MKDIKFKKKSILLFGLIFCITISSNMLIIANNLGNSNSKFDLRVASSNDYELNLNITRDWIFSNEFGYALALDDSGNIYFTGSTSENGNDALTAKYDKSGKLLWNKSWGGDESEISRDIVLDDLGNIYITGYFWNDSNQDDVFIVKYDTSGNYQWNKTWGDIYEDCSCGITLDSSGNIYITGHIADYSSNYDAFILKFDNDGILVDEVIWKGINDVISYDIALDDSGNIYIAGCNGTNFNDYKAIVGNFDSNLDYVSNITWGGNSNDEAISITLDDSGNVYITGQTYNYGVGGKDAFIVKFDNTWDLVFQSTWGTNGNDHGEDIILDDSGNIFITGTTVPFGMAGNIGDFFLAKYGSDGFLQWSELWEGNTKEIGYSIVVDSSGSIYVTGANNYLSSLYDAFIVKYSLIVPPESPGNPPYGLLDLLTSLVGWLVIIIAIGIGILSGLVIGKKRWDNDAIKKQNNKIVNLKKKQERIEKKKARLNEKQVKIDNQLKGYQKRLK